jgi:cathepsin D
MLRSILVSLLLFSSLSAAAAPPPRRDPIHIPMLRRRNARRGTSDADLGHYANAANALRTKYNMVPQVSRRAAQTVAIPVTNQVRVSCRVWHCLISWLTHPNYKRVRIQATLRQLALVLRKLHRSESHCPSSHSTLPFRSQTFNVVLDTGSSDLWFASTNCIGCVQTGAEFNPQKSSTIQVGNQRVTMNYGSGTAVGTIARDTVTMGPFTVNPQVLGACFCSTFASSVALGALFPGMAL